MSTITATLERCVLMGTLLAGVACNHETPPPQSAAAPAPPPAPPQRFVVEETKPVEPPPAERSAKTETVVRISPDVLRACHIDAIDDAPKFDFDSASLKDEGKNVLDKVADCVSSGPLKGKTLRLVGRADPRGTEDYNMALGQRRADSVASYLSSHGVSSSSLDVQSRGKQDAAGKDAATWQMDRRVDVELASEGPTP